MNDVIEAAKATSKQCPRAIRRAYKLEVFKRCCVYGGMLLFCLAFWALVIVGCSRLAHASPLSCESIKDSDQRHYCRAVSIPDRSECELIKAHDLRYECRARVR